MTLEDNAMSPVDLDLNIYCVPGASVHYEIPPEWSQNESLGEPGRAWKLSEKKSVLQRVSVGPRSECVLMGDTFLGHFF